MCRSACRRSLEYLLFFGIRFKYMIGSRNAGSHQHRALNMTTLITGGAGYIGSHMAHAMHDAGEKVIVLDNLSTGHRLVVPFHVPLVSQDCGNAKLVYNLITDYKVDTIIHLAASSSVEASFDDPLAYYDNNTVKSHTLIEAAIRGNVKNFIFSSTAAVYGNPTKVPVKEEYPLLPISPYGWSKFMVEKMLQSAYSAEGLNYVILRYFNVAGAEDEMRTGESGPNCQHIIKVAAETALGLRTSMKLFGTDYNTRDGTCIRDYIHVSDLVDAHTCALYYMRTHDTTAITANVGYQVGWTNLEIIEAMKRASGVDFTVERVDRRPGDPEQLVADTKRIKQLLNWVPKRDNISKIVDSAFRWEKHLKLQCP